MTKHTHVDGSVTVADPKLWGFYMRGFDEWHARGSRELAEREAAALNSAYVLVQESSRSPDYPSIWAIPDLWPFSAAKHAASLAIGGFDIQANAIDAEPLVRSPDDRLVG